MTPVAVVNALEIRIGLTGSPRQLRDAIEFALLDDGAAAAAAAEQVDRLLDRVAAEIVARRDGRQDAGEIAILNLRGFNNEIVHGSSFAFKDDPAHIQQIKLNRTSAREILAHMRGLTFGQFEALGRSVLRELGCTASHVTPHAGDQGIDFYGELSVGSLVGADRAILRLLHEVRVVLVGQAKHYPNTPIGPSIVRELVGALSLARTSTYSRSGIDMFGDVRLGPFSPALALIFSTGDFTKGARRLAEAAGLVAFSGDQLSVFLADKGVGLVDDAGTVRFDAANFSAWLARPGAP